MIDYSVDAAGIATICWNNPDKSANVMNEVTLGAYFEAVDKAVADDSVIGVVISSAKKDFIAGWDLEYLIRLNDARQIFDRGMLLQDALRKAERSGKPFVAAINGAALGGGLEIAMACHARVASDAPHVRVGLPEVTLGLLPGGGGTQRLTRLIGVKAAVPMLLEGTQVDAATALEMGIIDEVVPADGLIDAAKAWITDDTKRRTVQPWDEKGFTLPGGAIDLAMDLGYFQTANSRLHARNMGNQPAQRNIMACVFHGGRLDIDTGLKVERRYFAATVLSPEAKNMIRTKFLSMQEARKLANRPKGVPTRSFGKVGILGAGMMGAGIAHVTAAAGIDVVLLDRNAEAAEAGKGYSDKVMTKRIAKGRATEAKKAALLGRIRATGNYADLDGCDLVIEAVFEDRDIKADVTRKAEAVLPADAIYASNTSTLPITGLAEASKRPGNFIGLHFFSPVDRMPLVEVIVGKETSDETLAHALDYVAAVRMVPIVVNDSRGFYTSRIFRKWTAEGLAMLAEGVAPARIENAARKAGMPVGPLEVIDAVSIELGYNVRKQGKKDLGNAYVPDPGDNVVWDMVEKARRLGRKAGAGFYDYPEGGEKTLWPGLANLFPVADAQPDLDELVKRFIYVQSVDTARCIEEGVLRSPGDADVGALLGWGFPAHRGGPIGQIQSVGVAAFVGECDALAARHGPRFAPPQLLRDMAARGESFYAA